MTYLEQELISQPESWLRAAAASAVLADGGLAGDAGLPRPGERVAVVGCGTSWFVAQSYAARREAAGQGETDAHAASEFAPRRYDRVVAITRSGTTTELLDLIRTATAPVTTIVGDAGSPAVALSTHAITLPWADERSVVQTRFATSALALLRASLGEELTGAVADARAALAAPLPLDPALTEQVSFLGHGWTLGLAHEAALKCREAAGLWTEAYPAMEFRHGPIAVSQPGRAVWALGEVPAGLADEVRATGATFVHSGPIDPLAGLVLVQRFALAVAHHRGLDPDSPRNLTRSVILASTR